MEELIADREEDPGLLALRAGVLAPPATPAPRWSSFAAWLIGTRTPPERCTRCSATHVEADDLPGAEEIAREWLRKRPEDRAFRFQLAALLERQRRFEEAEVEFRKVLAAAPDHDLALNYLGYMLADQDERLDESEALIQRALAEDPYNGS